MTNEKYFNAVDWKYGFDIAKKLEGFRSNPDLGYRSVGSQAEKDTGDFLFEEMDRIGLSDVTRDYFPVDTWVFKKAELSLSAEGGERVTFLLGGYQTHIKTHGHKKYQVVNVGEGTEKDYQDKDVYGKLVLIEIDQKNQWWLNYPALEAFLHGAAAVLAMQKGGFSQCSPEALNAQDICGPANAPVFSISQKDGQRLKQLIEQTEHKEYTVMLDADSTIGTGESCNIIGCIPGVSSEQMILLSAHYDSYFSGFQDNNAAVGALFAIAKAFLRSGFKPQKTIVFCAVAAEEWGVANSLYDYLIGSYHEIFELRPHWRGQAIVNINFELPAYRHYEKGRIRASYEYQTFIQEFLDNCDFPEFAEVYPQGMETVAPPCAMSDDFVFSLGGIPTCMQDFVDSPFQSTRYHTQFDTDETFQQNVFLAHIKLYGLLVQAFDQLVLPPIDFSKRLSALKSTLPEEGEYLPVIQKIAEGEKLGEALKDYIWSKNEKGRQLFAGKDREKYEMYVQIQQENYKSYLQMFHYLEEHFVRLDWDGNVIFPHETFAKNVGHLEAVMSYLDQDQRTKALEELVKIDNNRFYQYFSKECCDYFTSYVLDQPKDRLKWGKGMVAGSEPLYLEIKGLEGEEEIEELKKELVLLAGVKEHQTKRLGMELKQLAENLQQFYFLGEQIKRKWRSEP